MSEHHYKFNVKMTCGGCSGAVERVLKKLDGRCTMLPLSSILPPGCLDCQLLAAVYSHD